MRGRCKMKLFVWCISHRVTTRGDFIFYADRLVRLATGMIYSIVGYTALWGKTSYWNGIQHCGVRLATGMVYSIAALWGKTSYWNDIQHCGVSVFHMWYRPPACSQSFSYSTYQGGHRNKATMDDGSSIARLWMLEIIIIIVVMALLFMIDYLGGGSLAHYTCSNYERRSFRLLPLLCSFSFNLC